MRFPKGSGWDKRGCPLLAGAFGRVRLVQAPDRPTRRPWTVLALYEWPTIRTGRVITPATLENDNRSAISSGMSMNDLQFSYWWRSCLIPTSPYGFEQPIRNGIGGAKTPISVFASNRSSGGVDGRGCRGLSGLEIESTFHARYARPRLGTSKTRWE